jgi:hypothetical protein
MSSINFEKYNHEYIHTHDKTRKILQVRNELYHPSCKNFKHLVEKIIYLLYSSILKVPVDYVSTRDQQVLTIRGEYWI